MKGVHNICKRCTEAGEVRRCFGPLVFDADSETTCCFCGTVIVSPEFGWYTRKVFETDVLVCNDDHPEDP